MSVNMMNNLLLLLFMFSIIFLIGFIIAYRHKKELEDENSELKERIGYLEIRLQTEQGISRGYLNLCEKMQDQMNRLKSGYIRKDIPDNTLEAVRYAMIHSHPDNGGDTEQFIKFKEVYDRLSQNL